MSVFAGHLDELVGRTGPAQDLVAVTVDTASVSGNSVTSAQATLLATPGVGIAANQSFRISAVDDVNNIVTFTLVGGTNSGTTFSDYVVGYAAGSLLLSYQRSAAALAPSFANGIYGGGTLSALSATPQAAGTRVYYAAAGTYGASAAVYSVAALDARRYEGTGGTALFTFVVSRTGDTSLAASLAYAVSGTGGSPADAADFAGGVPPAGTVAFAAGDASRVVTIGVNGDGFVEADETFTFSVTGPAGTQFSGNAAIGTILNDDVPTPMVTIPVSTVLLTAANLLGFTDDTAGASGALGMDAVPAGGPDYLHLQYIYAGSHDVGFATSAPNVFIHAGAGNDAIQVASGQNVLDGGTGSNFLTGGIGTDTFFTDARAAGVVWNTLRNFHTGDAATLWGFVDGVSSYRWDTSTGGAAGAEGATLRANIVGGGGRAGDGVDASITFAGLSVAQAQRLLVATGTQPAGSYLYLFNPGV